MAEVQLLGVRGSPFVQRVQYALKLKGIEYTFIEENLRNKSDLLLKYNPIHKKVPVFVHNGKPLSESLVIIEYIDETWENYHIFPQQAHEKALARFWSKFIDDKILPAISKAAWTVNKEEREKGTEEALQGLQFLENELKSKFFGGENINIVDIAASYLSFWLPTLEEAVGLKLLGADKFPKLHKWSQEFINQPIVKEILPAREGLLGFFKSRYAAISAAAN
ncbi:probable glutathione S-transferase [Vicia villosa]|uniref:probable glutathione S-transferase n=1 Tax=Vicia villosa TaxID=3911 RepID=UPI00273AA023|nr:probable glutathione S-transferase [Vicia villosa]